MGTDPDAFSGGEYCRWTSWAQTDSDALCARSGTVDSQHRRAMAHAAAELPELQNCASAVSDLVPRCGFASRTDGCCQRAKKNASSMQPSLWPRVAVGNRSYKARKRHESHGDRGSPWIAALGQHARGEPSRSAFGAVIFRLLHDRSEAGKLDRRSRTLLSKQAALAIFDRFKTEGVS